MSRVNSSDTGRSNVDNVTGTGTSISYLEFIGVKHFVDPLLLCQELDPGIYWVCSSSSGTILILVAKDFG